MKFESLNVFKIDSYIACDPIASCNYSPDITYACLTFYLPFVMGCMVLCVMTFHKKKKKKKIKLKKNHTHIKTIETLYAKDQSLIACAAIILFQNVVILQTSVTVI